MDFFVDQEGMINCNFWNTEILVQNVIIKTNKDVDLFKFIPNRFEVIFWELYESIPVQEIGEMLILAI